MGGLPRLVRYICAVVGTAVWAYWWVVAQHLAPKASTLVWLGAIVPWAVALFSRWRLPRPSRATLWAAIAISLLMVPRLLWLEDAPFRVTSDEACYSLYGLSSIREHAWEIFGGRDAACVSANYMAEVLQVWPALFVRPLLAVRLASALYGLLSLLLTYMLAVRLVGRAGATVAVTVLGCSFWHIVFSRTTYPNMPPLVVVPAALLALVAGTDERNRFLEFMGGVLLGTSFLVYDPARVVVPVALLWLAHRTLMGGVSWRDGVMSVLVIAFGAALFLGPYHHDQGVLAAVGRYRQVSMIDEGSPVWRMRQAGWSISATAEILASQVQHAAAIYVGAGAWNGPHDASPHAIIDPLSLTLGLAGLCVALARPRDSKGFLVLAWVACTFILGQVLTGSPNYRTGPIIPGLAIAAGLAGAAIDRFVLARFGRHAGAMQAAALTALTAVILPINLRYLRDYVADRSDAPDVAMARFVQAGSPAAIYYTVGFRPASRDMVFQLIAYGRTVRDVSSLTDALCGQLDHAHDAVFVLDPVVADAAARQIRRHYPMAVAVKNPFSSNAPILALTLPAGAAAAPAECEARAAEGPGLLARYYRGANWDGAVILERIEEWPFRWQAADQVERVGSIEWVGRLTVPNSGDYAFELIADVSTGSLSIGTQVALERGGSTTAHLEPGTYPLRLRCRPNLEGLCTVRWTPPGEPMQWIAPELLRPPADAGHAPGAYQIGDDQARS